MAALVSNGDVYKTVARETATITPSVVTNDTMLRKVPEPMEGPTLEYSFAVRYRKSNGCKLEVPQTVSSSISNGAT